MRPKFRLPRRYHWIKKSDTHYKIISGNQVMDDYSLGRFHQDSLGEDTLVCLKKVKGKPIAVIELTVHSGNTEGTRHDIEFYGNSLVVELLAVDRAYQGHGIGTEVMALAENIGRSFNAYRILLEAVEDKVYFYEQLGYTIKGGKYIDREWGQLVPMEKILTNDKFLDDQNA
ncbi:MAG: GNAT family N-acetyltransferase [Thermoplasmatales archaeon]|nr:GNAT family N-acetyltransferase [Thermoplasmatales archaeon]MCW6170393.1 GNAT family N-acetyltransferase [Thermoplasmatales archaeon]